MRKACIDVGSNSVILLIEEKKPRGWQCIHEETDVTSLGAGTKSTGLLSPKGVEKTLDALSRFYKAARDLDAESVEAYATMAARIARNTDDFLRAAEAQGTPVRVLSGEDEAQLGFEAVGNDPTFAEIDRITIVDVGGQSTEIVTAVRGSGAWTTLFKRSFPLGTLGLKGSLLSQEIPDSSAILSAVVDIDDTIGLCYLRGKCGKAVGLGATGTNLASIREKLETWDPEKVHGQWLGFGEISEAAGSLFQMSERERAAIVGIERGREATLPAGSLILERVLNAVGAEGCFVSARGWRHALLEQ